MEKGIRADLILTSPLIIPCPDQRSRTDNIYDTEAPETLGTNPSLFKHREGGSVRSQWFDDRY